MITWNDLGQALFPNAAAADRAAGGHPGARGVRAGRGVQVRLGRDLLLGRAGTGADRPGSGDAEDTSGGGLAGATGGLGAAGSGAATDPAAGPAAPTPPGAGPATCGRFVPAVCTAYTESATTGRLSPGTAELLRRSSPASVTDRITAPTLLVQGEQDTLFGLDQADANARQIAATGAPVKVAWFAGGHDGGRIGPGVRDEIGDWFSWHLGRDGALAERGDDPGTGFGYAVESGIRTSSRTPTGRTVEAADYPGLPGASALGTQTVALPGEPQVVIKPGRRQPGRDHRAARARRRAGQRRRPADRDHRRAARPVRPVPLGGRWRRRC